MGQEAAFATGIPPDIYAFHHYTGNSASLSHLRVEQYRATLPVEPGAFTLDLYDRLRALYAQ